MNKKDVLNFLGICRKAQRLCCGHDAVKESLQGSKARLVFLSSDASQRLEKEMNYLCTKGKEPVPLVRTDFTMAEFQTGIGKSSAVFSVTDRGFAAKIQEKFGEELYVNKN